MCCIDLKLIVGRGQGVLFIILSVCTAVVFMTLAWDAHRLLESFTQTKFLTTLLQNEYIIDGITVLVTNLVVYKREYARASRLIVFVEPAFIAFHSGVSLVHVVVVRSRNEKTKAHLRFTDFQMVAC
jgi:hypothetical protein